ncbi:transposase [Hymenobacter sp. UYP22]|uniref:transposase n=1 Tax=Hymenobacter sp. UYP22 TaxID=3156348 RepID=UPI0033975FFC
MPSLILQPSKLYHVYNRGNNQELLFYKPENYRYFLVKMRQYLAPHVRILAWCLMPNHFHLLLATPDDFNSPAYSQAVRTWLSSYTRAIQRQENRTGSLFQQHTRAKELDTEQYASICFCYIHQNPLRAGLARNAQQWVWSSYLDYIGLRAGTLCDFAAARELLDLPDEPAEIGQLILQTLPDDVATALF